MSADNATTSFFVIAKKDTRNLDTTIMHAGENNQEEAVAVFTQSDLAAVYLNQAGWVATDTVAELQPDAFLKWLFKLRESGVNLIAVNPDRVHQDDGISQAVIPIGDFFSRLAPAISDCLTANVVAAA